MKKDQIIAVVVGVALLLGIGAFFMSSGGDPAVEKLLGMYKLDSMLLDGVPLSGASGKLEVDATHMRMTLDSKELGKESSHNPYTVLSPLELEFRAEGAKSEKVSFKVTATQLTIDFWRTKDGQPHLMTCEWKRL